MLLWKRINLFFIHSFIFLIYILFHIKSDFYILKNCHCPIYIGLFAGMWPQSEHPAQNIWDFIICIVNIYTQIFMQIFKSSLVEMNVWIWTQDIMWSHIGMQKGLDINCAI